MIQTIFQHRWLRWVIFLVTGILAKVLLDVTYSLMYRNYALFQPVLDYMYAILLGLLVLEISWQVRMLINKRIQWEDKPTHRFFLQWFVILLVSLLIVFVSTWIFKILSTSTYYFNLLNEAILGILIMVFVSTMTLVELGIFLLEKWRFSLAELERFKKENAEFQFESLRSQVNPHFLFNSLNTLSSLVYENQEKAEAFIRELSDVYRYILENRGQELVTLGKELQLASSFIYLVHLRFEDNLNVVVDIPDQYNQTLISPLTLQLLIENAVKHNIISQRKPLNISIFIEDDCLVVKNNKQLKTSKEYSSQLGLKNIRSRYAFLTEKKMEVIENTDEFIVKIPILYAQ